MRNDLRQRGFTGAGRPPEDDRAGIVALNLQPQRFARADDMLLSDEFVQSARTHAVGERARAFALLVRECLEQTHNKTLPLATGNHTDEPPENDTRR
jgi:hypothetical protein